MTTLRRNGFALLMTLWLLIPIALSLLILTGSAHTNAATATDLAASAVLRAAADGGIETVVARLIASPIAPLRTRLSIGDATVTVATDSLSGLLNPNLASPELLRALLIRIGAQPARADLLAQAIVEWRSPGQTRRAGSPKAAEYRAAGLAYGPPGAPFETLAELLDVIGMTPGLFAALRPTLSLFTDRPPNPALAPPPLRAALQTLGIARGGPGDRSHVFRLTATATVTGRRIVTREAIVQISTGTRPWRVLAWETVGQSR